MSESRFFEPSAMTIGEIVALTGVRTRAGTDLSCRIANIAHPTAPRLATSHSWKAASFSMRSSRHEPPPA